MTSSACSRLSRMLLSRWLCAPPSVPSVSFSADATSLVATFAYSPPGPYNAGDVIELQLHPASPEVVAALGPLACWVTFHEAPFAQQRRATLKDMQPGRAFGARVRARNAAGAEGAWSEEQLVTTLALPVRCGGVGPGYTWCESDGGSAGRRGPRGWPVASHCR